MGLRQSLRNCLSNSISKSDLRAVIDRCYTFALAYLRMKASTGKLYMFHGERLEDLAWDFIADIFEKDTAGNLRVLKVYFAAQNISEIDDQELDIMLRRLVFTKVEDGIFKAVGDSDPSLKKIIRNLKLAIRDEKCEHTVCFQEGYLIVERADEKSLPVMPSEFMKIKLASSINGNMQIPEILVEVIDALQGQTKYQKRFSLVSLAIIIREVYVHFYNHSNIGQDEPKAEVNLIKKEFDDLLEHSVEAVKLRTGDNYVERGKISSKLLNAYMNASKKIVKEQLMETFDDNTQYTYLKKELPDLSYSEFRNKHRQILEYLVKLIRSDIVDVYKKEWL